MYSAQPKSCIPRTRKSNELNWHKPYCTVLPNGFSLLKCLTSLIFDANVSNLKTVRKFVLKLLYYSRSILKQLMHGHGQRHWAEIFSWLKLNKMGNLMLKFFYYDISNFRMDKAGVIYNLIKRKSLVVTWTWLGLLA